MFLFLVTVLSCVSRTLARALISDVLILAQEKDSYHQIDFASYKTDLRRTNMPGLLLRMSMAAKSIEMMKTMRLLNKND